MKKALECEMSVIGALLISKDDSAIQSVFCRITVKAFEDESLREIYQALKRSYQATGKTDFVLTMQELPDEYKNRIMACMELVPAPSLLPHYADKLFDQYRRRVLLRDLTQMMGDLSQETPTEELLHMLDRSVETQNKLGEIQQSTSLGMTDSIIEYLNSLYRSEQQPVRTGFDALDQMIGGLAPKSINIISGRSGMGKSDFSIFLAVKLATQGVRVLYLSMEMPRTQIMARIASRVARIDSSRLQKADALTGNERNTVAILLDRIAKIPLILDEQQGLTVEDVRAKIRKHRPQVVFIDHMQLMAQENQYRKGWENLAEASRELKRIAMRENIIFVELVQQNADVEKRRDKTPVMSDVKGTDVFTNDADTMMFLQADPFDRVLQDGDFVDVKLYIRKNRHGKTGMLRFRWQPQYHRYLTISNMEE